MLCRIQFVRAIFVLQFIDLHAILICTFLFFCYYYYSNYSLNFTVIYSKLGFGERQRLSKTEWAMLG